MVTAKLVAAPEVRQPQGAMQVAPRDTSEVNDIVGGSIDSVRQEVDDAFADVALCHQMEPDELMRVAGGHTARLSFIRVCIMRVEDYRPEWKSVRVREVEPCIEEMERQWRNGSRLEAVRDLDWRIESGAR